MDRTPQRRRQPRTLAGVVAIAAVVFAACSASAASTAPSAAPSSAPPAAASAAPSGTAAAYVVKSVQDAKLGAFLAGEDGKTLYVFTKDAGGKSVCNGACAQSWPPFTVEGSETVTPGDGVTGAFATIKRDDGTTQVTYAGSPLYYFAKDTKAGDVTGQGVGGVWFVAAVAGGPGGATASAAPSASVAPAASAATGGTPAKIVDFGFDPASLTVKVGTTVTWTNTGSASHTVTADDGSFDSKSLAGGDQFSQTFAKAGTFTYHCAIHPSMKGTVTVQ